MSRREGVRGERGRVSLSRRRGNERRERERVLVSIAGLSGGDKGGIGWTFPGIS